LTAIQILVVSDASWAQTKRVALVIGNSSYQHTYHLENPVNDASEMAAVLKRFGFVVHRHTDLDKSSTDAAIKEFASSLVGADTGIFFYAGHGLQVAGQNYLVPIDAKLTTSTALDFEMTRLDFVQRIMEREVRTNIIFLDACRDNPLARNLARSMGTRSIGVGRGLAAVESGLGTLISFSTQPGNVALDGIGRNSPFVSALVKHIGNSQEDLNSILIAVRNDVISETQNRQVPWEHSALTARFFFGSEPGSNAQRSRPSEEKGHSGGIEHARRDYELATRIGTKHALEAFLAAHPNGLYSDLARAELAKLTLLPTDQKDKATSAKNPSPQKEQEVRKGSQSAQFDFCLRSCKAEWTARASCQGAHCSQMADQACRAALRASGGNCQRYTGGR